MVNSIKVSKEMLDELTRAKVRELALLRAKQKALRTNALAYYRPHPKQAAFHNAWKYKRRMFRAGNRTGKSTCGVAEDAAFLLRHRAWLPKNDPAYIGGIPQHPIKLLIITSDWDKVDEIFTSMRGEGGKLIKMLPPDSIKRTRRNHSGVICELELHNGSIASFDTVRSFMTNPLGSESSDWDAIHVDEPCPYEMWKAVSRGLIDRHGPAWFTLTPLSEFWINDLFFPKNGVTYEDVWAISASTYDNPYLSPEAIAAFERELTEDEKQCRLYGLPLELSGLVYKEFDYDKHVLKEPPPGWKDFSTPPDNATIYVSIDPHTRTPHAVVFIAVDENENIFVFDEIFEQCLINELAERIKLKIGSRIYAPIKCDPSAFIEDPITRATWADEFAKCGLFVERASKSKSHGIMVMRAVLKQNRGFYVSPTCTRWIWEIQRYCYKNDKPIDKDDHLMEATYRLLINKLVWIDPADRYYNQPIEDETFERVNYSLDDI